MEHTSEESLIKQLWKEHLAASFPEGFRGKDMDGIDFVMLDADIAGCVDTFLERGNLNLFQTAMLGLSYRHASDLTLQLNGEAASYFSRLERLAGLVLKAVALKNEKQHEESG